MTWYSSDQDAEKRPPTGTSSLIQLVSSDGAAARALHAAPKVLLHTHLEGSVPVETLLDLSKRNSVSLPHDLVRTNARGALTLSSWGSFRALFAALCSCFGSAADFTDGVVSYGQRLAAQRVVYAEIHCSPWKHLKRGLPLDSLADGLVDGAMITHNVHGVHVRIILDLTRNPGEDIRSITDWAKSLPQEVFVGVGVSGGEGSIPRPEYAPYTSALKASGFRLTVHAGELEGPESVREALDVLEADRIGHGVRSWEDAALLARLAAEQVHLEVCPAANRVIGISAPPLRSMLDAGINLSINTDDETVFGTDLECECAALVARHELTVADCVSLFTSAATSSFDAAAATAAMSNATLKP